MRLQKDALVQDTILRSYLYQNYERIELVFFVKSKSINVIEKKIQ